MSESPDTDRAITGGDLVTSASLGGVVASGIAEAIKLLPDDAGIKPWASTLAPWIAVLVSSLFLWARRVIKAFNQRRNQRRTLKESRETIEKAIANATTPPEKKAEYMQYLSELEDLQVTSGMDKVRSLFRRPNP